MTNLSVRMEKESIDELDSIAELLGIDRVPIVRKIISTRIKLQKKYDYPSNFQLSCYSICYQLHDLQHAFHSLERNFH